MCVCVGSSADQTGKAEPIIGYNLFGLKGFMVITMTTVISHLVNISITSFSPNCLVMVPDGNWLNVECQTYNIHSIIKE